MLSQKLMQFWASLRGEHQCYHWGRGSQLSVAEVRKGANCLRVYRNNDGTWSLMPNWFNTAEQNHKRSASTVYETFDSMPENIQEKLSVLLLHESGGDWLTGIGKRVDDGVFWLEDG